MRGVQWHLGKGSGCRSEGLTRKSIVITSENNALEVLVKSVLDIALGP